MYFSHRVSLIFAMGLNGRLIFWIPLHSTCTAPLRSQHLRTHLVRNQTVPLTAILHLVCSGSDSNFLPCAKRSYLVTYALDLTAIIHHVLTQTSRNFNLWLTSPILVRISAPWWPRKCGPVLQSTASLATEVSREWQLDQTTCQSS